MCGRFSLHATMQVLLDRFMAESDAAIKPRYNIAPGQDSPVILKENPRKLTFARWGLIPSWAKDEKIGYKTINARAEGIEEKPAFRHAFAKQRCLIPADGFYEWTKAKDAYRFTLKDEKLFSFAGLYEYWKNEKGEAILSFSIITVEPNDAVKKVHTRMPAILSRENEREWLSEVPLGRLKQLIGPYPSAEMESYRVSNLVNYPSNDTPEVIKRIGEGQKRLV